MGRSLRQTSRKAIERIDRPLVRQRVLWTIRAFGPISDLRLEEILGNRYGCRPSTVRGRRAELVAAGAVEKCGKAKDGRRYLWRAKKAKRNGAGSVTVC